MQAVRSDSFRMADAVHVFVAIFTTCILMSSVAFPQSTAFDRAVVLFHQKQWVAAADSFDQIERNQPGLTDAPLYRAKSLVNLNRFAIAEQVLRGYITTHPESEDASSLLAYVFFRENKPKESLQQYTEAGKLKPPTADDLKIAALDYVLLSDYVDASHYLEISLQLDPNDVEARYHLGRIRYVQNRFDEAIASFNEVLKREPHNVKAEDNLGLSLEAKNKMADAMDAYRKAIEFDKGSPTHTEQPYLNYGSLLTKSNRSDDAVTVLSQAREINPASSKVRYELGKALFDSNHLAEAQQEEEEAVRLAPNDASAHYLLAKVYQRMGKSTQAAEQFKVTENLKRAEETRSGNSGMASGGK